MTEIISPILFTKTPPLFSKINHYKKIYFVIFERGPSKDHSTKVWLQLVQWFLEEKIKMWNIDGRTTDDRQRTKSILWFKSLFKCLMSYRDSFLAHLTFRPCELLSSLFVRCLSSVVRPSIFHEYMLNYSLPCSCS
jgi:hypothetical protein